jgi:N-glycosidase YbiA
LEGNNEERVYKREGAIVFRKTNAPFGGLSNMAAGYPIVVNGITYLTSEALYQACRFPHMPEVQQLIISQKSPMTAKMKSKPFRKNSRDDWDTVRLPIMRWCLRVKLFQNWAKFGSVLNQTGDRLIVEESMKDVFWGAKPLDDLSLKGVNALGRLLMELREEMESLNDSKYTLNPPKIKEFYLLSQVVPSISFQISRIDKNESHPDKFEQFKLF